MDILSMMEQESASTIVDQMLDYNLEWIELILKRNGVKPGTAKANQMVAVYVSMIEAEYRRKYE